VAALAYLIVFASIVAFFAYTWLLKRMPASLVGTHAYVNPLVAVALGVTFGGEPLTRPLLVGAAVIAASVAIVLRRAVPQPRRMVLDRQADGVVPAQRVRRAHASLSPKVSKLSP
jgi:drug/metabolite transporter (DMT)-like permease